MYEVKDSGARQEFPTGAVRDIQTGKGRYDLIPTRPLKRLALRYEGGAAKYNDRNWEKGIPYSRMFDSALRHLNQAKEILEGGSDWDEDHLAAVLFNVMGIMHFQDTGRDGELNDLSGPPVPRKPEMYEVVESEFKSMLAWEYPVIFDKLWTRAFEKVNGRGL